MTRLTEQDKSELLADARRPTLQAEFAAMNARSKKLTPAEWVDFLTQVSRMGIGNGQTSRRIKGDRYIL